MSKREYNIITATPLPSGYTRLNYIEATGTQYIDTNYYVGNKKTRIVGEMMKTYSLSDKGVFFGCGSPSDNQWFINPYFPNGAMQVYMLGFGLCMGAFNELNTTTTFDCTVDIPNNLFEGEFVNGDNIVRGKKSGLGIIYNAALKLFSSVKGSTIQNKVHARLYFFQIYENNVLVHNYIPALRDLDSKPGLYDVAAGEFKTNNGTSEFLYN